MASLPNLVDALRRRGVIRACSIYAGVAWLLIGIADILLPMTDAPDWLLVALMWGLIAGLPITAVLSWLFKVGEQGVELDDAKTAPTARLPWDVAIVGVLLGALFVSVYINLTGAPEAVRQRLAVLPFNNYSGSGEVYLADGIADSLIGQLSLLGAFPIASRASSFALNRALAEGNLTMADIRERLNVRYIVEGSLQPSDADSKLTVSVRLIDAAQDTAVWTQQWDATEQSILAIQKDIARSVANAVIPEQRDTLSTAIDESLTSDERAYEPYLRGREFLRRARSFENLQRAQAFFDDSLSIDPAFAQAHAGLCEAFRGQYLVRRESLAFVLAQQSCARALELDPNLVEVNLSLGALYRTAGDYERALANIEIAKARSPERADVFGELGRTLDRLGRIEQAEGAFIRAIELDPSYWGAYMDLANFYYGHVEYDDALALMQRTLEMAGTERVAVLGSIGTVQFAMGEFRQALANYERVLAEETEPQRKTLTNLGLFHYHLGCYGNAAQWQKRALELAPEDHRVLGRLAESCRFLPDGEPPAQILWAQAIAAQQRERNQADWESKGLAALYHAHRGEVEAADNAIDAMWGLEPEPSIANYYQAIVTAKTGGDPADAMQAAQAHDFPAALLVTDPDLHGQPVCPLEEPVVDIAATCIGGR